MPLFKMFFFVLILLFLSSSVYPADTYNHILRGMALRSITIIGENHKKQDSIQFFQSLINRYLQRNQCLIVALEIASNQQAVIDQIVQGRAVISDIEVPPMIDHQPFRALIDHLTKIQKQNKCFKLVAIDAGMETAVDRDVWMAKNLNSLVNQTPILVLLGSLHTLKMVVWDQSLTKGGPSVAEILVSLGHNIST